MKPIQVIPPGLMGLLQLKQTGRLPDELADVVAPMLEMRDWYLQARILTEFGLVGGVPSLTRPNASASGTFLFTTNPLQVPQNTIWYVDHYAVRVSVPAADYVRFGLHATDQQGLSTLQIATDYNDVITARNRFASCALVGYRGLWLGAGQQLGIVVMDILTAAGLTFSAAIRAVQIPI